MKTNIMRSIRTLCLMVMVASAAVSAFADDASSANDKKTTGTIISVNAKDKVLKIREVLFTKNFVIPDGCSLIMADKKASLADFQPGQRVQVFYREASGVSVASRVAQEKLTYTGQVTSLDLPNHSITVRQQRSTPKAFALADNCSILLNGNSKGEYSDVKLGSRVTVVYEVPNNQLLAREIEQKSLSFTGTLGTVNVADRTVVAGKRLLGDKTFHLSNDCAIVKDGTLEGRMNDLRVGRAYEMSYETVDGVNVVNRIALAPTEKSEAGGVSDTTPNQSLKINN